MMQNEAEKIQTLDRAAQSVLPNSSEPAAFAADDIERQEEALLDEAIELTFPASDPISVPSYHEALEKSKWRKDHTTQPTN